MILRQILHLNNSSAVPSDPNFPTSSYQEIPCWCYRTVNHSAVFFYRRFDTNLMTILWGLPDIQYVRIIPLCPFVAVLLFEHYCSSLKSRQYDKCFYPYNFQKGHHTAFRTTCYVFARLKLIICQSRNSHFL